MKKMTLCVAASVATFAMATNVLADSHGRSESRRHTRNEYRHSVDHDAACDAVKKNVKEFEDGRDHLNVKLFNDLANSKKGQACLNHLDSAKAKVQLHRTVTKPNERVHLNLPVHK
jgi:hypothetical protein